MKKALLSVYDKTDIVILAKELILLGYELFSTGGTQTHLESHNIKVTPVEKLTEFPEIMDGRVKTLHPKIHGALLGIRNNEKHIDQASALGIEWINLLVVNLYPFRQTVLDPSSTEKDVIEHIDIGGPAMIRSAAKNWQDVGVVTDPSDYEHIIKELSKNQMLSKETKRSLAGKAFRLTAQYDTWVASYFTEELYPDTLNLTYQKVLDLRYGENPHQTAALYEQTNKSPFGLLNAKKIHGKDLSYNNIKDAQAAYDLIGSFESPTAVVIKHMNPCGISQGKTIEIAFIKAHHADPISIFGGIVAFNRTVTTALAEQLSKLFLEVIMAPDYEDEALELLMQKKQVRLLTFDRATAQNTHEMISVSGGLLIQSSDNELYQTLSFPTIKQPNNEDIDELLFSYKVVKHMKSNAIALTKAYCTVGLGVGQTSRIGAAVIAFDQAKDQAKEAYLASDAFLPMADTVELAARHGIKGIIQPGGSIKDQESIDLCNQHGLIMVFTHMRHFKH
ncbi:MAG: bifunctional phosphoribosylaminoimidazolecarboxamide formyltransferase/IMP cyclohydrolase [Acholeplasmataceae bacterium]